MVSSETGARLLRNVGSLPVEPPAGLLVGRGGGAGGGGGASKVVTSVKTKRSGFVWLPLRIERRDEYESEHEPGRQRRGEPAPLPHRHHSTAVAMLSVFAPASFASSMTRTRVSVVALLSA